MKRKHIYTIKLQEEKIAEITERNRQLESGYRDLWRQNQKLRARIRKLEKDENQLSKVNV